jgi:hypothetical protein
MKGDVTRKIIESKCFHLSSSWQQKSVYGLEEGGRVPLSPVEKSFA